MELRDKIQKRDAKVAIIGLGYVGLPLAVDAAKAGFKVTGIDMQDSKVNLINNGKNYIGDVADDDLREVVKNKNLQAVKDFAIIKDMDVIVICVPTPLNKYKEPNISYVQNVSKEISKYIKKDSLVILESTTYPGTTEEIVQTEIEKSGLKAGDDFFLVFSPERVDPGNKKYKTHNIPKVIGGINERSSELASAFYGSFIEKTHIVSSPRVAEMTKLLENIFRIVNISMINELALLAGKMKIDIWEVIEAASTKPYGFMPFYPGPGLGGHCIPIDPFYLSWKAKEFDFYTRFISLAGEINDLMPHFVVTKVISALNSVKKSVNGSKILVLGVAYKKDIEDLRESPALKIIKDLIKKGADFSYNDNYVPELKLEDKIFKSEKFTADTLQKADCVLITTDHSYYDENLIVNNSKLIVDTRNVIKRRDLNNLFRL